MTNRNRTKGMVAAVLVVATSAVSAMPLDLTLRAGAEFTTRATGFEGNDILRDV